MRKAKEDMEDRMKELDQKDSDGDQQSRQAAEDTPGRDRDDLSQRRASGPKMHGL